MEFILQLTMKVQKESTDTDLLFLLHRRQTGVSGQRNAEDAFPTAKTADPHSTRGMNRKAYWNAAILIYLSTAAQCSHDNLHSGSRSP